MACHGNTVNRVMNDNRMTNNEMETIFIKYERVLSKYYWFSIHPNIDEFNKINLPIKKSRIVVLLFLKLCSLVFTLRCVANVLWATPFVRDLTCDGFHYLGNPRLINLVLASGSVSACLALGYTQLYVDLTGMAPRLQHLTLIRSQRIRYKLNDKWSKKLYQRLDLMTKVVSKQFIPLWIIYSVLFCTPTLIGYFDASLHFSSAGVLFCVIIISGWVWDFLSVVFVAITLIVIVTLSIIYYFKQISDEIRVHSINYNYKMLIKMFSNHIYIENTTKLINDIELKYYIYCTYKIVKPCLNTLVYLSHAPDTKPLMKYLSTFMAILLILVLISISYLFSSVTTNAHKSQKHLYKLLMTRQKRQIPIEFKLKILRFIERLSGPEIGFYCYEIFPITSYYFADYVLDSMASYFLILSLLESTQII